MPSHHSPQSLDKARLAIAGKVRELRQERRWTQAELSKRLQLSQSRLSEIERGASSFTAEQFLTILRLFNVPASHFSLSSTDQASSIQNALARLGALHLQESADVLPSESLQQVGDVVRETLVTAEYPRLITALAPVLVRQIDRVNLKKIAIQLTEVGLDRRLAWLVDNALEAVHAEMSGSPPRPWAHLYRRAEVVFVSFLDAVHVNHPPSSRSEAAPDILDRDIRSKQTLKDVVASSSKISRRWGIVSSLQPKDFSEALRAARAD